MLVRESRIIARLLLEEPDHGAVRERILAENLLQNGSPATTRKYCRLVLARMEALTPDMVRSVAKGSEELARSTLLAGVLRSLALVADFMEDVLLVKVQTFEPALCQTDWPRFLEERATVDPSVREWSETSRKKMGQVVFRMLAEAGYLQSTRSLAIQFPGVPNELRASLESAGDERTLNLLQLGRG